MSVYKDLSQREVNIREFHAYKEFTFTQADSHVSGGDIRVQWSNKDTSIYYPSTPTGSGGFAGRSLYDSVNHLYYHKDYILEYSSSNLYTGVVNTPRVDSGGNPLPWSLITTIYDPYHNFGPNYSSTYKNLGDSAVVISVPQEYFGERIKPGTVHVEDVTAGFTLVDDEKGNLYNSAESASFALSGNGYHRGNVFYEHGIAVITSLSGSLSDPNYPSPPNYQSFGTGSNQYFVKFKSTEKLYELEAVCTAKEGEFNLTMNPSARVGRSLLTSEPLGFVTSSEFSTYPTTIGLYNNDGYLVAVGKVAQPIRNDSELALTIVTRLYW